MKIIPSSQFVHYSWILYDNFINFPWNPCTATYLITYPASSHILPLRVDPSISIKSFSVQIKAKPQTSIVHNGSKTRLVFLPFLYYKQVTDPKTIKTRRKALSKSHILEGPHSHPCLLGHSIPSYMMVFPEKKLPKSRILEGSTFTSMSSSSSSLYSFLHGDVSWRKIVQILHSGSS